MRLNLTALAVAGVSLFLAIPPASAAAPKAECGYGDFVSVRDTLRPFSGGFAQVWNNWGFTAQIDIKPDCRIVWVSGKGTFPKECNNASEFWASGRLMTSDWSDQIEANMKRAGSKRRAFMLSTVQFHCE